MNRTLILGIAIFFAVVGIALLGGDSKAVAGHGCHGCNGGCAGICAGGCAGYAGDCCGCHGGRRHRLFGGHHRRRGCCGCDGGVDHCAPACPPSCACPAPACAAPVCAPSCAGIGGGVPVEGGTVAPPPPPTGGVAGEQPPPPPTTGASARRIIRFPVVSFRA